MIYWIHYHNYDDLALIKPYLYYWKMLVTLILFDDSIKKSIGKDIKEGI